MTKRTQTESEECTARDVHLARLRAHLAIILPATAIAAFGCYTNKQNVYQLARQNSHRTHASAQPNTHKDRQVEIGGGRGLADKESTDRE